MAISYKTRSKDGQSVKTVCQKGESTISTLMKQATDKLLRAEHGIDLRELTRMFHELLSRDREDGRVTGQPQGVPSTGSGQVGSEAY